MENIIETITLATLMIISALFMISFIRNLTKTKPTKWEVNYYTRRADIENYTVVLKSDGYYYSRICDNNKWYVPKSYSESILTKDEKDIQKELKRDVRYAQEKLDGLYDKPTTVWEGSLSKNK